MRSILDLFWCGVFVIYLASRRTGQSGCRRATCVVYICHYVLTVCIYTCHRIRGPHRCSVRPVQSRPLRDIMNRPPVEQTACHRVSSVSLWGQIVSCRSHDDKWASVSLIITCAVSPIHLRRCRSGTKKGSEVKPLILSNICVGRGNTLTWTYELQCVSFLFRLALPQRSDERSLT